jgi:hypothetical protein
MDSRRPYFVVLQQQSPGHRHSSRRHAFIGALRDATLRSECVKCGLLPDTQGNANRNRPADLHVASSDAIEGAVTDWVVEAFDVTVVLSFTEMRERSVLLLASARTAGHAATLAESRKISAFVNREADIQEFLRKNDAAQCEHSFQSRSFALHFFGAYRVGVTAILHQLSRKCSEHTSMTMGPCTRLAFQYFNVALQTASARMLRSRKAYVSCLSVRQLRDQRAIGRER